MRYQILHNIDTTWSESYAHGDRLADGYEGDLGLSQDGMVPWSAERLAEIVFQLHNRDDRPDGQLAPSLSIGDVVDLGEISLSVARSGFVHVDVAPADRLGVPYLAARELRDR